MIACRFRRNSNCSLVGVESVLFQRVYRSVWSKQKSQVEANPSNSPRPFLPKEVCLEANMQPDMQQTRTAYLNPTAYIKEMLAAK